MDAEDDVRAQLPDVGAVVVMRMGTANAGHHVRPICAAVAPRQVVIVRPSDDPAATFGPNAVVRSTSARWRPLEVLLTAIVALWVTVRTSPDHLFSFNAVPYGIIASWIGLATRTPVHVGFVGTDAQRVDRQPWLLRLLARPALTTTTGSAMDRLLADHDLRGRVEVLDHGVDAARFHERDVERDIDVVFVGGLLPHKRVDLILRALARARRDRPQLSAVVVGGGPEEAGLRALARTLDLTDSVHFAGHDPRPEEWLARAELLVMASAWEGLPFVVVEAMRCGTVPVVNDVGSITDLIDDGESGILLSAAPSPDEVGEAIVSLLDDAPRLASVRAGALRASAHLTYESVAAWWRGVLSGDA